MAGGGASQSPGLYFGHSGPANPSSCAERAFGLPGAAQVRPRQLKRPTPPLFLHFWLVRLLFLVEVASPTLADRHQMALPWPPETLPRFLGCRLSAVSGSFTSSQRISVTLEWKIELKAAGARSYSIFENAISQSLSTGRRHFLVRRGRHNNPSRGSGSSV